MNVVPRVLEVEGVVAGYGAAEEILKGPSIYVDDQDEIVSIIGLGDTHEGLAGGRRH